MSQQTTTMFGIDTVDQYLAFCDEAVAELELAQDNVLRAFAAILALNHIPDWLRYKLTSEQRQTLGLIESRIGESVKEYFESRNADLKRVREIANGFKHLALVHSTQIIAGYGMGPFDVGPFGHPYLLIDLGADKQPAERWDVGLSLCQRVLVWWHAELSRLGSE